MEEQAIRELNGLTTRFYSRFGESFSDTRQAPWPGWEHLVGMPEMARLFAQDRRIRVLDVGCGNCRFERFLMERFPKARWEFLLVDSAPEPAGTAAKAFAEVAPGTQGRFAEYDLVEGLLAGEPSPFAGAGADLTVAFGLMHHIPSDVLRLQALEALIAATRPGGLVAITFWQFLDDPALAAKAHARTAEAAHYLAAAGIDPAALESGDCILGWQDAPFDQGAMRYCHHFGDNDIDRLVERATAAVPSARVIARWRADGRTGALNTYVVIER